MPICQGCGREGLKRSGIIQHCRLSRNPRCQEYLTHLKHAKIRNHGHRLRHQAQHSPTPTLNVSPTVDVLSPYDNISTDLEHTVQMTFVNDSPTSTLNVLPTTVDTLNPYDNTRTDLISDDSDDDNNNVATHLAQEENGLEPRRHTRPPSDVADPTDLDQEMGSEHEAPTADNDAVDTPWSPSRREAELDLERRPFIATYPGGMAGAIHSKAKLGENQKYERQMGKESQENVYAPFASQLDWEVAKWAKMRGPSSTSFTELMTLDGVSRLLGWGGKDLDTDIAEGS